MNEISLITEKLLMLSMLKGIGPSTLRKIASMPDFEKKQVDEIAQHFPLLLRALQFPDALAIATEAVGRQIDQAKLHNARILSPLDKVYPRLLAETKDDPFLLYVKGKLSSSAEDSVAIIGTREPTSHGNIIVQRIAQFFVGKKWSVVSGLAIGCDATAHQATLDAGGHTVAVLAHGLHTIAPTRHRKLAEEILSSGGALVSEYPFGQPALPQQFVKRDRTQAGLARGVVMIQSDLKGGSLHASRAALDYGRWLAVPYPTELDRNNNEPKIQANMILANGALSERRGLLRCLPQALESVMILRGKEDYMLMVEDALPTSVIPSQDSLL